MLWISGVSLLLIFSVKVTSGEAAGSRTACPEKFNVSEMSERSDRQEMKTGRREGERKQVNIMSWIIMRNDAGLEENHGDLRQERNKRGGEKSAEYNTTGSERNDGPFTGEYQVTQPRNLIRLKEKENGEEKNLTRRKSSTTITITTTTTQGCSARQPEEQQQLYQHHQHQ